MPSPPTLQGKDHVHVFESYDYDDGAEYGFCSVCHHWIDTATGENETERFEREVNNEDGESIEEGMKWVKTGMER